MEQFGSVFEERYFRRGLGTCHILPLFILALFQLAFAFINVAVFSGDEGPDAMGLGYFDAAM